MRLSRFRVMLVVGLLLGAGVVLGATTFNSGDAGKVSDGVSYGAPDGMNVTLYGEANVSMEQMFPDNRTVELNTSEGNISVAANSSAHAAVHTSNMTGAWTNITAIDARTTWIEVYPQDKQRVDVRGDADRLSVRSMALDDGTEDFWVNGTDGGTATVRIHDVPADTNIAAVEDSTGELLDHNTSTAGGTVTLSVGLSEHTIRLVDKDDTDAPDYSNARPQGVVSDTPDELTVDVSDGDFPEDEVEVNISLDGSQIHSENITANGTVNTSNYGELDLGDHTWTVNATDSYGNFRSMQYEFSLPENITIRNETNASEVITGQNVTATFYSADGTIVVQRSDSNGDGNISMRGLPDTEFVVSFDGDGFYNRRAYIESIGDQQNVYLLNSTAYPDNATVDTTFVYEDRTGNFPREETTLRVQRAVDVNNDNESQWETVAGDYWGAVGEFDFTGEYQQRYRLVVKNQETGDRRILGTHTPTSDGIKNIIVGRIIFDAQNGSGLWYDAGINQDTENLQMVYTDPTGGTSELTVRVIERGNKSNEIFNQTVTGEIGQETFIVDLNESQLETNYIVQFEADGQIVGQVVVGGSEYPLPIDPDILGTLGMAFITFIASLYGPRTANMGAWAIVLVSAGMMLFGWVQIPVVGLTVAVAIAAGGTFYRESVPG